MVRPPVFPAEEKVRVALSILAGGMSVAEAARRSKVSDRPETCVWQLDNSRVRDDQWWDLAPRRVSGLLVEVRPPVPHLPDREHPRRVSTRSSSPWPRPNS